MTASLADFAAAWKDEPDHHKFVYESFRAHVATDPELSDHRNFIEAGVWGFGDRSFHWLWKLIVNDMPPSFRFLEIGVHCGQVTSLVALLAKRTGRDCTVVGVSPFNGDCLNAPYERGNGDGRDYRPFVLDMHKRFALPEPHLIQGYSDDPDVIRKTGEATGFRPYDCLYIDGSHNYEDVKNDIERYAFIMLNPSGGLLVCDDSACSLNMPRDWYRGFDTASRAIDELLPPFTESKLSAESWEHLGNCGHNRVWRRR